MKKTAILLIITSFLLSACSEKDEQYYLSNYDKAEVKLKQCENDIMVAFTKNDESAIAKLEVDQECKAASSAIKETKRQKRETEKKAREAAEEAKKKEVFAKIEAKYSPLSWQERIKTFSQTECAQKPWLKHSDSNLECLAEHAIYESALESGKAELGKVGFMTLKDQFDTYCSKDARQYTECTVWKEAVKEQGSIYLNTLSLEELINNKSNYCPSIMGPFSYQACEILSTVSRKKMDERINELVNNHELLKQEYNKCVDSIATINEQKHSMAYITKRNEITNSIQCVLTKNARTHLQLPFDNFETKIP